MDTIKINKKELLKKIKSNRELHATEFFEALKGYREEATKEIKKMLENVTGGNPIIRSITCPEPVSHVSEYDMIISMLEMSVDKVIELEQYQFKNYVLDQWDWKKLTALSNTIYLKK